MGLLDFLRGKRQRSAQAYRGPRVFYTEYLDLSAFETTQKSGKRVIYVVKNPINDENSMRKYLELALKGNIVIINLPYLNASEYFKTIEKVYSEFKNVLDNVRVIPTGGEAPTQYFLPPKMGYYVIFFRASEFTAERLEKV